MTDTLPPFPDAPTPRTLDDALRMLAETRRLIDERSSARRGVSPPRTLQQAIDQLAVDRETLVRVLREDAASIPRKERRQVVGADGVIMCIGSRVVDVSNGAGGVLRMVHGDVDDPIVTVRMDNGFGRSQVASKFALVGSPGEPVVKDEIDDPILREMVAQHADPDLQRLQALHPGLPPGIVAAFADDIRELDGSSK